MRWYYIPIALLVFGILIFIHELGHFVFARLFRVSINEFSIGMGPKVIKKRSKKSGIAYSLRLLPIGGYVSMVGEDERSDDPNAFGNKKVWQRIVITVAGAFMNVILGFVLMFIIVFATKSLASTTIYDFTTDAVSFEYGLAKGDRITKVNGTSVNTGNSLFYEVMHDGGVPIDFTVIRDGEEILIEKVEFKRETEQGVTLGSPDFIVYSEDATFLNLMKHSFSRSVLTVKMVWDSIVDLISGKFGVEAVSGPVGTTSVIGDAASQGISNLAYIVCVITINLGIMNLLPFPALDGGRLIFLLIELVSRRKIKPEIEGYINLAGIVFLFGLMILITFKDILGLF